MNTKSLKLFNVVHSEREAAAPVLIKDLGIVLDPKAAPYQAMIEKYLRKHVLNSSQLNSSFYTSWEKVKNLPALERLIDQVLHYASTYGSNFQSEFIYKPNEKIEGLSEERLKFIYVRGVSKNELVEMCFDLLESGIALAQETAESIIATLQDCRYQFKPADTERIKNREALILICEKLNIVPVLPVEALRYVIYKITGETLLIKSNDLLQKISKAESAQKRIGLELFNQYPKEKFAMIFNRYKPIFLALKKLKAEPVKLRLFNKKKPVVASLVTETSNRVNQISKLSKTLHVPLEQNVLNSLRNCTVDDLKTAKEKLLKVPFFQIARALNYLRQNQLDGYKVYQIRNGKTFTKEDLVKNSPLVKEGFRQKEAYLLEVLKVRYDLSGQFFHIPEEVEYAIPTSEKAFVGNVPIGTKFTSSEPIAAGIYWKNSGGARDLDLSAVGLNSKVGWNASYQNTGLLYSGDMTDARDGAVEYMYMTKELDDTFLLINNVYSGKTNSEYKIILGRGPNLKDKHMMHPKNVWFEADATTVSRQSLIGVLSPEDGGTSFLILNGGSGSQSVSGVSKMSSITREAIVDRWQNSFSLNELLVSLGAEIFPVMQEGCADLSPRVISKESLLKLFI